MPTPLVNPEGTPFCASRARLLLAPMQDVTNLALWRILEGYGGADCYVTEYIRVYPNSLIDKTIEREICENDTGRPLVAQIAGEDIASLVKIATQLQRLPIAGVDLNLGCPAQVVCRKKVGGALLKDLAHVGEILKALRQTVSEVPLSAKCRLGYEDASTLEPLLETLAQTPVDWMTLHGRSVRQGYSGEADWQAIEKAARILPCPVVGNGDLSDPARAARILKETPISGVMIGRGAIRNPWIFAQTRAALAGQAPSLPTGRELMGYLLQLKEMTDLGATGRGERPHVERIKKFLNFVGEGLGGDFLYAMRRAENWQEMQGLWQRHLDHERPLDLLPRKAEKN